MDSPTHLLFAGHELLIAGDLLAIALGCKQHQQEAALLVFHINSGRQIDIDVRGSEAALTTRYGAQNQPADPDGGSPAPRGRGRPRLGVTGREVTLLPRHWAWLDDQRGGASATLRRLVDDARRSGGHEERVRQSQDRANRFLSAIAGDLPGFEEANRALFAQDAARYRAEIKGWPKDVRRYALEFAKDAIGD